MTVEIGSSGAANPLPVDTEYAEHSAPSKSKKVISGPLHVPRDPADAGKSIDPIAGAVGAASVSITLLRRKAYRVISSTACYFRETDGAGVAVAGDIYLPADQPIVLVTTDWDTLSFIQVTAGGVINAVEVK